VVERETFIHDDLGAEHVLVDDAGRPVGIIDFEDATVGDPEVDRLPVHAVAGQPLTERMWFYRCRGTLHALVHYVREGLDHEIPGALAELRRRLDSRPGQ
jgi:aminoglycoside phosphotransferase (APT) family kinase protein